MVKLKNYRIIAELLPKDAIRAVRKWMTVEPFLRIKNSRRAMLRYFFVCSLGLLLAVSFVDMVIFQESEQAKKVHLTAQRNLGYWEYIIRKYPNFPDAYYKAALYSIQMDKEKTANEYLDRAISLDPAFKEALELKKKISE